MSTGSSLGLEPGYRLTVEDDPREADVEILPHGLEALNERQWPGHQQWRPLGVFVRDGGEIIAGLAGETYCGWLFVRYLWVSKALRGRGIGRALMSQAEARARSFQAPGFYQKLGYEEFARLDYSQDHQKHFLRKRLIPEE